MRRLGFAFAAAATLVGFAHAAPKHKAKLAPRAPLRLEHIRGDVRVGMVLKSARKVQGVESLWPGQTVFVQKEGSVELAGAGARLELLGGAAIKCVSSTEVVLVSGPARVRLGDKSQLRQIGLGLRHFALFAAAGESTDVLLQTREGSQHEVSLVLLGGRASLQRPVPGRVSAGDQAELLQVYAGDEYTGIDRVGGPFAPRKVALTEVKALYRSLGFEVE